MYLSLDRIIIVDRLFLTSEAYYYNKWNVTTILQVFTTLPVQSHFVYALREKGMIPVHWLKKMES